MAEYTTMQVIEGLEQYGARVSPTGSRYIVSPPPEGRDIDYLVEGDQTNILQIGTFLEDLGFAQDVGELIEKYPGQAGTFYSWRKGDLNLIVTADPSFARDHRQATEKAKTLNLRDKPDRIALFRHILYNAPRPEFLK